MKEKYVPGVCNIDFGGRRKRKRVGVLGIASAFAIWGYFSFVMPSNLALLSFIPAWIGFIGFWQAHYSFCVADAALSQHEIGGKTVKVAASSKDKERALQIHAYSILSALAFTAALYILAMFVH